MERNHDPVIEFALLSPGKSETRPLPIDDERGRERHVNLCLHPDLRRAESCQVAGGVKSAVPSRFAPRHCGQSAANTALPPTTAKPPTSPAIRVARHPCSTARKYQSCETVSRAQ